jgi:hypothetical protein
MKRRDAKGDAALPANVANAWRMVARRSSISPGATVASL